MGMRIVFSALPLLYVLGVLNGLVTPPLWEIINFINGNSFPSPNIYYYVPRIIADYIESFTP